MSDFGLFLLIVIGITMLLCAVPLVQIMASSSNIRAKKHPECSRKRHRWQRWEVWCSFTRDGQVLSGKEVGWFPYRWMAQRHADALESSPQLLIASMDSLANGVMTWTKFEVRHLP